MRVTSLSLVAALALGLAACGGGAAGGSTGSRVVGSVVAPDGSDLGGIVVECPGSGEVAITDLDGTFVLDVPAGKEVEVEFTDPAAGVADPTDCPEGKDPVADGIDIDGGKVTIEPLEDGESCECDVVLDDGTVVECHLKRGEGEDEEPSERGEGKLVPTEAYENARGEVELHFDGACVEAEIEVGGFDGPRTLSMFVFTPDGASELLGTIAIDEKGAGHLELAWCEGDPLPFGAGSIDQLAGFLVLVLDENGDEVFEGHVPTLGGKHEGKDGKDDPKEPTEPKEPEEPEEPEEPGGAPSGGTGEKDD